MSPLMQTLKFVLSHRRSQPGTFLGPPESGSSKFQKVLGKRKGPECYTFQNLPCAFKQKRLMIFQTIQLEAFPQPTQNWAHSTLVASILTCL